MKTRVPNAAPIELNSDLSPLEELRIDIAVSDLLSQDTKMIVVAFIDEKIASQSSLQSNADKDRWIAGATKLVDIFRDEQARIKSEYENLSEAHKMVERRYYAGLNEGVANCIVQAERLRKPLPQSPNKE